MVITLLALLLVAAALLWAQAATRPQPLRVRRNPTAEELRAAHRHANGRRG